MKILIVEDNRSDRELLRYMMEERFARDAKFREASNLRTAIEFLRRGDIDCVLLDLQLPDSTGRETFQKISSQFPSVPIIVMTHTQDRALAMDLVRMGAADYVTKNYTDEEAIFQRILLAIEKHRYSIRVPPETAASVQRVEQARVSLDHAHQSGEHRAIQSASTEAASATAVLVQQLVAEFQRMNSGQAVRDANIRHVTETTDRLQREILEGDLTTPSMKARMSILEKNVSDLTLREKEESNEQKELRERVSLIDQQIQSDQKKVHSDIRELREDIKVIHKTVAQKGLALLDSKTKVIVAILGIIATLVGAWATYRFGMSHSKTPTVQSK